VCGGTELKCAHLEANAALELARVQQRTDKLALAIGNALKVKLDEKVVERYQLCLEQMVALTKLNKVLDLGEKGFSYLQSAYDEACSVNVEVRQRCRDVFLRRWANDAQLLGQMLGQMQNSYTLCCR
jgi:hypothetical protein